MSSLRMYLVLVIAVYTLCRDVSADALDERVAEWERKFLQLQTSVWNDWLDLAKEKTRITLLENRLKNLQVTTCNSPCEILQKELTELTESRDFLEKISLAEKQHRVVLEEQVAMLRETVQDAKNGLSYEKQQRLRFQDEVAVEKRKRASIEEQLKTLQGTRELARKEADGGWGTWSAWTVCSVTCGSGRRSRSRACTRPRPENGGENCVGSTRDEGTCEKDACSLDGGWGTWSAWTVCSVTCGNGRRSRSHACTRPRPENGGQNCVGNARDEDTCEKDECPLDGGWGTWSAWTVCSVTCGSGRRSRNRACTRPIPENGGHNCVGNARDEGTCEKDDCPLDGGWGTWSAWTVCSVTCGSGRRSRSRVCTRPRPENGGQICVGNARDEGTCEKDDCPFTDCWDLRSRGGFTESGVYSITPAPGYSKLQVRCDMTTDGGGWTVLQKRHDGSVNFGQTFKKYEDGFGDVSEEHWLGLRWINLMTSQGAVHMRVDLCRFDDLAGYAVYDGFSVSGPGDTYTLHSGVYRTGSMADYLRIHDGREFQVSGVCADEYRGGWWYHDSCFNANLNGGRYNGGFYHGIAWSYFGGDGTYPNVRSSELKIRPLKTPGDPTRPYTCPP